MKQVLSYCLYAAVAAVMLIACQKKDDGGKSAATPAGNCGSGYVYSSQYGCLQQGNCPSGQGLYNNQCTLATGNIGNCSSGQVYTQYGCLAQGNCPSGQARYGNQCVMAYNPGGNQYCVNGNCNYNGQNGYNYQYQNGYFVPMYPQYYGNPYQYNYGYPYYGGGLNGGFYFRF